MYNKIVGKILRIIRGHECLTQKSFGEAIGKSEIAIRKYENGDVKVPYEVLYYVINFFEIDMDFLKLVIKECKDDFSAKKTISEEEFNNILEPFYSDILKIYKMNTSDFNEKKFHDIEKKDQLLNQLKIDMKSYILELFSSSIIARDIEDKISSIIKPKKEIEEITNDIISYLNFVIFDKLITKQDEFTVLKDGLNKFISKNENNKN